MAEPPRRAAFDLASLLRIVARLAALLVFVWLAQRAATWVMDESELLKGSAGLRLGLLIGLLVAYSAMIALPFVPGVELGVALMMVEGAAVAPLVYLATVTGLLAAFAAGQAIPYGALQRTLADLHLRRADALVARLQPLDHGQRLALLRQRLPAPLATLMVGHRHLALAVLVNLPGNSVLGGGGGILLLAGLTRLFRLPAVALTMALAVAPVPILVWLFDLKLEL
ncbi:MAG: hypothetical protein Q8Q26_15880 [Pseudorhodobacter sp.]|nr:hypothetical protein [Pseudorhodobacter sp.]